MSICCSRSSLKDTMVREEMHRLEEMTRFNQTELVELKTRFSRMTNNSNFLTKIQFRENMGVLGLGTMLHLSDRIFDIIDDDRDGKIRFQDFAMYFDKVCYGDAKEKAEISFKLIDRQRLGYFTSSDFSNAMHGVINSWAIMTGQHVTNELKKQLDIRIQQIFETMDQEGTKQVSLSRYQQCMMEDPHLLEIFDFINRGKQNFQDQQRITQDRQEIYMEQMHQLEQKIENLIDFMKPTQQQPQRQQQPSINSKELQQSMNIKARASILPRFSSDIDDPQMRHSNLEIQHSPITSILQFNIFNILEQHTDLKIHSFQKEDSVEELVSSPNDKDFSFTNNQKTKQKFHPKFTQIPQKVHVESIPDNDDVALNHIEEVESEEEGSVQDIKHEIHNASEGEIRKKYAEVLDYIQQLNSQVKQLKQQIGQDKYIKNKQEFQMQFNEAQLNQLRLSTHKNVPGKQMMFKNQQIKKPKISVSFGHANFNLVMNMMIGIQMAVNSINIADYYEISNKDFKVKYYFELLPRRNQSEKTSVKVCQFFDYAPQVFNSIRTIYGIDNQLYLKSIGPESLLQSLLKGDLSSLQELTSTGKSGSFFYYTQDGKFTLKTIHHHEFKFLKEILKNYYYHIKKYSDSLIIKFFGMHKIGIKYNSFQKQQTIYFVIMSNIFSTTKEIHIRYDLKGSLYKRETLENDPTIAKKDLDFIRNKQFLSIDEGKKSLFLKQVEYDCKWFADNNIIDYSLLVGIHNHNRIENESVYSEQNYFDNLQIIHSKNQEQTYYFGIIDILTNFSTKKKIEYLSKRLVYGPTISAIPPMDYASRFLEFMQNHLFTN